MASTTSTSSMPRLAPLGDASWLRLLQGSIGLGVASVVVLGYLVLFTTTVDQGDFHHAADYWLTATGLPLAVAGIGIAFGVHRLQHGADGRLGTIGVWINIVALVELFAQLLVSVLVAAEVRWGPSYPVFTLLSFVGVALLAAGSWRTGLLPKWMLGVWPLVWIIGSLAAQGPTPFLLVVFLAAFGVTLTRRVRNRVG